ncbi:hypothetical protein [uncultured Roseibium sp.]|uniref:hypothetical protein n=1 Tax=uncultured Roseibium sp. TaxID=1936171 RepID=UPI00263293B2|nr:hypothetical protein [uncultured Roseibium sp.]
MSKSRDDFTLDLFKDWVPPRVSVGFEAGVITGNRLASRISRAVAKVTKDCDLSRPEIAGRMSEFLGSKVTTAMLETYASEAKTGNNITVERFIALIQATGKTELLGFIADEFDLAVIPRRYENVIHLALIEDHERMVATQKKTLQMKIRGSK